MLTSPLAGGKGILRCFDRSLLSQVWRLELLEPFFFVATNILIINPPFLAGSLRDNQHPYTFLILQYIPANMQSIVTVRQISPLGGNRVYSLAPSPQLLVHHNK